MCRGTLKGVASVGDLPFGEGWDCGGLVIHSPERGCLGSFPSPRLQTWGPGWFLLDQWSVYEVWVRQACAEVHPTGQGFAKLVETHGDVSRIKKICDNSGSSIILSTMVF